MISALIAPNPMIVLGRTNRHLWLLELSAPACAKQHGVSCIGNTGIVGGEQIAFMLILHHHPLHACVGFVYYS